MLLYTIKRCIGGTMTGQRNVSFARLFCYLLLAVAAIEFVFLNLLVLYVYKVVSSELSHFQSGSEDDNLLYQLYKNPRIRTVIGRARAGGFVSLLQETIERLYIIKETDLSNEHQNMSTSTKGRLRKKLDLKEMYSVGLDVSHSGEALFLYKKILSRNEFPYHYFIVDIGANDGLVSSNSFNFIQMGWNAVLVEPQIDEINLAKKNLNRYIIVNRKPPHKVHFVNAAVGSRDGAVMLLRKRQTQESYVLSLDDPKLGDDMVEQVPSVSVKTLASKYAIPKNFGILSIDAEGMGPLILRQWFALKFTPAYIIFERLHIREPFRNIIDLLEEHNYRYLGTRGWNIIYEHMTP